MSEEDVEKDITPILLEDLGMRFATDKSKQKSRYGLYKCLYCGKEFEAQTRHIKSGQTKSCGCQRSKHNMHNSKLYAVWDNMKQRCYNPNNPQYIHYGGRGIKIYEAWLKDFNSFYEWTISIKYVDGENLSIDRIDVNGNYEPDNCRWANREVQSRNIRDIKSNNTSGFRGVSWCNTRQKWRASIKVKNSYIGLGYYNYIINAAKSYERFVRLNNLEHNFTPVLSEDEIEELINNKENR